MFLKQSSFFFLMLNTLIEEGKYFLNNYRENYFWISVWGFECISIWVYL